MRQNYARHDAAGLISIKHLKLFTGANTMPQWRAFLWAARGGRHVPARAGIGSSLGYLKGWRHLSLDQVEDATSDIDVGQDPRFGCGTLRAVRAGKPWRQGLPDCYVGRLDALKRHYTS